LSLRYNEITTLGAYELYDLIAPLENEYRQLHSIAPHEAGTQVDEVDDVRTMLNLPLRSLNLDGNRALGAALPDLVSVCLEKKVYLTLSKGFKGRTLFELRAMHEYQKKRGAGTSFKPRKRYLLSLALLAFFSPLFSACVFPVLLMYILTHGFKGLSIFLNKCAGRSEKEDHFDELDANEKGNMNWDMVRKRTDLEQSKLRKNKLKLKVKEAAQLAQNLGDVADVKLTGDKEKTTELSSNDGQGLLNLILDGEGKAIEEEILKAIDDSLFMSLNGSHVVITVLIACTFYGWINFFPLLFYSSMTAGTFDGMVATADASIDTLNNEGNYYWVDLTEYNYTVCDADTSQTVEYLDSNSTSSSLSYCGCVGSEMGYLNTSDLFSNEALAEECGGRNNETCEASGDNICSWACYRCVSEDNGLDEDYPSESLQLLYNGLTATLLIAVSLILVVVLILGQRDTDLNTTIIIGTTVPKLNVSNLLALNNIILDFLQLFSLAIIPSAYPEHVPVEEIQKITFLNFELEYATES